MKRRMISALLMFSMVITLTPVQVFGFSGVSEYSDFGNKEVEISCSDNIFEHINNGGTEHDMSIGANAIYAKGITLSDDDAANIVVEKSFDPYDWSTKDNLPDRIALRGVRGNTTAYDIYAGYGGQLTSPQKQVYDALVSQYYVDWKGVSVDGDIVFDNFIFIPSDVDIVAASEEDLFNEIFRAYEAFVYDYPVIFWAGALSARLSYKSENGLLVLSSATLTISETYSGAKSKIAVYNNSLGAAVDTIYHSVPEGSKPFVYYEAIHDWVCQTLSYNDEAIANSGSESYKYAYSSGSVFTGNPNVVCEGYGETYKTLCDHMRFRYVVPLYCAEIVGFSARKKSHMWNYVIINDRPWYDSPISRGEWYAVDTTWDDQDIIKYSYFLCGANSVISGKTFAEEHIERDDFFTDSVIRVTYPVLNSFRYDKYTANDNTAEEQNKYSFDWNEYLAPMDAVKNDDNMVISMSALANLAYCTFDVSERHMHEIDTDNGPIFKCWTINDYLLDHKVIGNAASRIWAQSNSPTLEDFYKNVVGNYEVVQDYDGENDCGFYAVCFREPRTGKYIISYRGTADSPIDGLLHLYAKNVGINNDWATDLDFALRNRLSKQFTYALGFYQAAERVYGADNIVLTGHSLGGALATYVSICTGARAFTIDGANGHVVETTFWQSFFDVHHFTGVDKFNFVNLTDKTGIVANFLARQEGSLVELLVDLKTNLGGAAWDTLTGKSGSSDVGSLAELIQAAKQGKYPMITYNSCHAKDCVDIGGIIGEHSIFSVMDYDNTSKRYILGSIAQEFGWATQSKGWSMDIQDDAHVMAAIALDRIADITTSSLLGIRWPSVFKTLFEIFDRGRVMLGTSERNYMRAPSLWDTHKIEAKVSNIIFGGNGADIMIGYLSADVLVPGYTGTTLEGGNGSDFYIIDSQISFTQINDSSGQDVIFLREWDKSNISISKSQDYITVADGTRTIKVDAINRDRKSENSMSVCWIDSRFFTDKLYNAELVSENVFASSGGGTRNTALLRSTPAELENRTIQIDGIAEIDIYDADGMQLNDRPFSNEEGENIIRTSYAYYYGFNDGDGAYSIIYLINNGYSVKVRSEREISAQLFQYDSQQELKSGISAADFSFAEGTLSIVSGGDAAGFYVEKENLEIVALSDSIQFTYAQDVEISEHSLTLEKGSTAFLSVNISPENAVSDGYWTSSNPSIVSVSDNGFVTAKRGGVAEIRFTAVNGKSADCAVTVPQSNISISFNANGGSGEMNTKTTIEGDSVIIPNCLFAAPTGKHFKTWSYDEVCYPVGSSWVLYSDISLNAEWEDIPEVSENVPYEHSRFGNFTSGITWSIDGNGILSVSGEGILPDFDGTDGAPWHYYASEITSLTVEDGVESIGHYAFADLYNLMNVTIADSVTAIRSDSFLGCVAIENVTLPFIGTSRTATGEDGVLGALFGIVNEGGVTQYNRLEDGYYHGYSYAIPTTLKTVTVTDAAQISFGAFHNCAFLQEITLNEGVETIAENAFQNCKGLTELSIPATVTSVGAKALAGCSALQTLTVPFVGTSQNAVESDGVLGALFENAESGVTQFFKQEGNSLYSRTYDIPTSLKNVIVTNATQISFGAFCGCASLDEITLNEGILSIAPYAFSDCTSLKNLTIPSTATTIENRALAGCSGLQSLTLPFAGKTSESNNSGDAVLGHLFAQDSNGVTQYARSYGTQILTQTFAIPESLTSVTLTNAGIIPFGAFSNCSNITQITLNSGITSIGDYAFYNCGKLGDIYFGGDENTWNSITKGENNTSIQSAVIHFAGSQSTGGVPSITGALSLSGTILNYTAQNVPDGAILFAASYDTNGALADVKIITNVQNGGPTEIAGLLTGTGFRYSLYLTDASYAPLCGKWTNGASNE